MTIMALKNGGVVKITLPISKTLTICLLSAKEQLSIYLLNCKYVWQFKIPLSLVCSFYCFYAQIFCMSERVFYMYFLQ